jgi:hypothetical protein
MVQVAPVFELVIDELATVVAVDTLQGEGEFMAHLLDAFLDPAMGAVEEGFTQFERIWAR